ncbi:HAD-IB family hydrolase [Altererythrobacter aurantiacus]|uniref:HAD-IB family hydrolase n=1 Tax=Parapontixanthobacter aurantiacus TaxID=1463599 RepID=A0A844ZEH7_9SPHN|nr:haloacid dehalogenase-like hydrolase [Parapontixanthobacter aurantiacus]MXO86285.1 HAD-IB family hydrolase [Parapontixanthobacter aurantiacus]
MRIAIYDLDNTLTRRATFTPFLAFAARRIAPWRLILLPIWVLMMLGYRAGLFDRTTLKTYGMRLMLGKASVEMLQRVGHEFASTRANNDFFMPAVLALLDEDRRNGAHVVIATAAFDFYALAFADLLLIETVIGSRWDGRVISGGNCYGETKLRRVQSWAKAEGLSLDSATIRFVSDSFADAPLLELADEPIFVSSSASKRARAKARGWRVISAD